jgi:hypothetical protein
MGESLQANSLRGGSVTRMQSGIQYLKYYRGITTGVAREKLQVDGFVN